MIKNIKLMLVAVMAMLSMNSFAAVFTHSNGTFTYTYDDSTSPVVATITGFASEVAASYQQAVTIPAQVFMQDNKTQINVDAIGEEAFKGNTNIQTVLIPDANVATIKAGAFTNCTSLESVTFGKKVAEIQKAFNGCSKLATVTFNTPAKATEYQEIAAGAFEDTAIETLDLTASHVQVLDQLFEEMNTTLTTVKLPATLITIKDGAFKSLATLSTIDWSACNSDLTIGESTGDKGVFSNAPLIKELVLPAKVIAIELNALKGSNIQKLTITSNTTANYPTIKETGATKLTELIIAGEFKGVIGDDDANKPAFTSLTDVTFKGTVAANAITAGAFSGCTKLKNVTFEGALAEGAVKEGAFGNATACAGSDNTADAGGYKLFVTYKPAADKHTKAFNLAAFSNNGSQGNYVKLSTTTAYKEYLVSSEGGSWTNTAASDYFSLDVIAAVAKYALKVASNGTTTYKYAKLYSATAYKIAKKQDDATVVVYGAYVDQSDANIYMENLHIIDGYYYVPAGNAVIVKSTSDADVQMEEHTGTETSMLLLGLKSSNEIATIGTADATGWSVKEVDDTKDVYFLAPFADYGYLWSKFKDERVLIGTKNGSYNPTTGLTTADFIVKCNKSAAARLNVVWLDGSEETTAIKGVENKTINNGAIYNLAGQQVDANYKGVVIKNGKKMIQK